jgi:hypothetical protein
MRDEEGRGGLRKEGRRREKGLAWLGAEAI